MITTPWGKRQAMLVVVVSFFARETTENLMRGIEAAFAYFGGVPKEMPHFGPTPLEPDDRLALFEILDGRYRRLAPIADAVMGRLAHNPCIFDLKGGSRREATHLS